MLFDGEGLVMNVASNAAHGVLANDIDLFANDTLSVPVVNGNLANVGQPVQGLYGTLSAQYE
jgi:hypothetical protein